MSNESSRRDFIMKAGIGGLAASAALQGSTSAVNTDSATASPKTIERQGAQRLHVEDLAKWESLGYGMFIHYGMSTYVANELPDGKAPASTYAPDRLDVDQWISTARDAGMKYAVLTAKHVAGHCLWPSKYTEYSVAHSSDKTDVVEKFVKACERHGVLPGFYYCSWDNHHRFGGRTPSDPDVAWCSGANDPVAWQRDLEKDSKAKLPAYVTSLYQEFQTAQITELLTQYGPIAEVWIDIPGVLGRGYREFLYDHIVRLQGRTVIMMNSGISTGEDYPVAYAWPADIIAIERRMPPERGHQRWRTVEGKEYYLPGEVCDPIAKNWFWVEGDVLRPDEELANQLRASRQRGVNLLLDVPPDRHGVIPRETVAALMRLRANVG